MPCTSHLPWCYHSNYIWLRVQVLKYLIMQFWKDGVYIIQTFTDLCFSNTRNYEPRCFHANVSTTVTIVYSSSVLSDAHRVSTKGFFRTSRVVKLLSSLGYDVAVRQFVLLLSRDLVLLQDFRSTPPHLSSWDYVSRSHTLMHAHYSWTTTELKEYKNLKSRVSRFHYW
jgi:hypothetical protein